MILLSILLILLSSYLILSVINKTRKTGFIYFSLITFAQIILSFEFLSLFKLISKNGFLICNIFIFICSSIVFLIKKSSFYKPEIELKKILFSLKTDKILGFISVCFLIFLIIQLWKAIFAPITFGDALGYYFTRCTSWIQQGSINHFAASDSRELIMPCNMDFLYTFLMLFAKSAQGSAVFSYIGFLCAIYVIYNLLKEIGFSIRRCLWSVCIFSSFALVSIEMYNPCSDLFTGALILSSIYLFLKSVKYDDKISLYFSSLAYALAAGTKTTAIIAIPAVFIVLQVINYLYNKKLKNIFNFTLMFVLNLLIFSSYNYILNFIHFNNLFSNSEQLMLNQFRGGFKGWLCNLVKYIFAIFDISGIKDFINYNGYITYLQSLILSLIGETDKSYTSAYFNRYFYFNSDMSIVNSALGITGLFAFLPSIIKSIKKFFGKKKLKKHKILSALTFSLILNLIIFSGIMVFTQSNMRYLLTFVIISAPIVVYSYAKSNKSFIKILLSFFMFIYFLIIPFYPYPNIKKYDEINIYNYFVNQNPVKIGLIISQNSTPNYYIEKLKLHGFYMKKIPPETAEKYNFSGFDYIIANKDKALSTNITSFKERLKYPDMFIYNCTYYDYKQMVIYDIKTHPAMVQCEIPFERIEEFGFYKDNSIDLENYNIYKKSN